MEEVTLMNMTNEELNAFIDDLNSKYAKLRKVAKKMAKEMDSIFDQYHMAKKILNERG